MKKIQTIIFLMVTIIGAAQVGINTTSPEGVLDVVSTNDTGIVVPRISSIENVTDGNGNPAPDGTIVYDLSRDDVCYRVAGKWICTGFYPGTTSVYTEVTYPVENEDMVYVKASNTDASDYFGRQVAISDDGNYVAIGTYSEASDATGINGDDSNNSASSSGAVYVFFYDGTNWSQQAYIKASNAESNDYFGWSVAINADGSRLVVGAEKEKSSATGVNGNESDNSANGAGAAYVFARSGTTWTQEAYLKASNTEPNDYFGTEVSISGDGTRIAVGARQEDSNATGINGNEADNSANSAGAVYVFSRSGTTWSQEAYVKASNTGANDIFGKEIVLNSSGGTMAVAASSEDSNATGINGDETNNSASQSGAVYVYSRSGTTWSQQAYIKASNTDANDYFGASIDISGDGSRLVVGANNEDSNATGVNGNDADNSSGYSGAAYVFLRSGVTWAQEAYVKASNNEAGDFFGSAVTISSDGTRLGVGTTSEDSDARGFNGNESNNDQNQSGALYTFLRSGTSWSQENYIKSSNSDAGDNFSSSIDMSMNGSTIVCSSTYEDGISTGINGDQTSNGRSNSGAVYIITQN